MAEDNMQHLGAPSERRAALDAPASSWAQRLGSRPLPMVAAIWIAYLLALALADYLFAIAQAIEAPLPATYYGSQLAIALAVLVFSLSPRVAERLGRAFLPLIIVIMASLPLIATSFTAPSSFLGPLTGSRGLVGMRTLPMVTVAVVLTAWQYPRRYLLLLSLGETALFVLCHQGPNAYRFNMAALGVALGIGCLILGSCVSALMDKLRAQSASLEHANRQLRHYASTLEQLAISRERNRVARELHDTLAHTLSGLTVHLETTRAYWEVDHQATRAMVEAALQTARTGLQETRRALKALRATPLADLGLSQALCQLAEQAAAHARLRLRCEVAADLSALPLDLEQCIYRVAQEAIANVTQHADADSLHVSLSHDHGKLQLAVRDNGRGFIYGGAAGDSHFGLTGMRERAALAGGQLVIVSAPGEGTTVTLIL